MSNTTSDVKKTDMQLILKLAKYLFMNRLFIIIAFATLVLELAFGVLLPFLSSIIIDEYILKEVLKGYTLIIFLYFSFYVLSTVFGFIGGYLFSLMGENAVYELRKDTFDTIQSLSIDYFDETATGDTISRMTNDLDQMQPILSGQIVHSIFSFILVVCMFLILFTISPALTILSLISLPIILGTLYVNNKYVRPRREE
ncbi:MAG: ABC transporter transmembrane domain-containing protein, partial [Promethearchaeota archaeon]